MIAKAKGDFDVVASRSLDLLANALIGAALSILLMACDGSETKEVQKAIPWTASELVGYRYEMIHPGAVAVYVFSANGSVRVTSGSKTGPVTAPIMRWRIDEKGVLILGDTPGMADFSLIKVESTEDRVVAMVGRERREFSREKVK